ncbi:c-type cytochrome [Mesorhizobium dulcispinae]|uniref:c-type cytochrome n=1 Tax=Mesorhizobium dulcispinae TaxID=3072316 RepID=UPI002A24D170|nr:cytochrome c [Mesorhizobium sp. VK23D]
MSQVKARRCFVRYSVGMKRRKAFRIVASAVAAVVFASPGRAGDNSQISYGKRLVETNCARCHAVGTAGPSTHPDAPPFRLLHLRYPLEDLQEALAEGISTGHPDMPEFVATPDQIEAIIAYIGSLDR